MLCLFSLIVSFCLIVVVLLLTLKRHVANAADRNNAMVEVLVEPGGQEATAFGNDCKLSGNPTERLARSDSILEQSNLSPIQQFYNGQSIFITGGTGFVGKLLIEKLLRECPGISFVYLLIRPKKGKDMHQRIEEIFDDPVKIFYLTLYLIFFSSSSLLFSRPSNSLFLFSIEQIPYLDSLF